MSVVVVVVAVAAAVVIISMTLSEKSCMFHLMHFICNDAWLDNVL